MKDAQIFDGWCQRVAQNLSRIQFNISHVKEKKKKRSWDGQPHGVKMRCLALHWCLLNNSWRLLKWPQTQTYKLLIVSTMIVYNGSLELYINNKAFLFFSFFLKPFPAGWVWGFQRNRVCLLHLEVESAGLVMPAAQLLWITRRRSFILRLYRACPNTNMPPEPENYWYHQGYPHF